MILIKKLFDKHKKLLNLTVGSIMLIATIIAASAGTGVW